MGTAEAFNICSMCGGHFPGRGIEAGGQIYCCDQCAEHDQHKMRTVARLAPRVIGILSVGALLGYLIGRNQRKWA